MSITNHLRRVGITLRGVRKQREHLQVTVAGQAGVTPSYLSQVEQGKRTPSPELLESLCRALGINPDLLLLASLDLPPEPVFEKAQAAAMRRLLKGQGQEQSSGGGA
ncbi:MAG: helix-turn-helix domain-containing protein [Armatimonadia bacterium]|nr:helix-turn-helix domain-containing protein [Armatimonadia bacterium]